MRNRLAALPRYLWAGPTTILGLAAALASLALPRVDGPIALCPARRGFARWFLARRGYCAVTLGHVVLVTPDAPPDVLTHEMVHVHQCERWGPLFVPAYVVAMLVTRLRGGDPYWNNPFELEARACEATERDVARPLPPWPHRE